MFNRRRKPAPDIRSAAVALIARRDFSRAGLVERLVRKGYPKPAAEEVALALVDQRLLDDARYVENFVRREATSGHGPLRIRQALQAEGIAGEAIEAALAAGEHDFAGICGKLRARRFGEELPATWEERVRQARFLQYRGFSSDHIRAALKADPSLPEE
jgi:regulatory protein